MEKRRGHFIWKVSEQKGQKRMKCALMPVQKNCRRIWTAVDRHGKRFLDFVIGDRSGKTAEKFWNKIKHHNMNRIASDYRKLYERHYPWGKAYSNQSGNFYSRRL
ncbi:hypothetical protein Barb4_01198 [Bacteroidales bacterium Barb4]|nr:hypothetical protein Barb4_01198 [Bacteroidales bacterium Barb4]